MFRKRPAARRRDSALINLLTRRQEVTPAARCQEFEEQALVHLDSLYRTALRLTRNRAEAADVVQDTCLRAFKNFHRFTPGTNCRAWLFTILRRVFLNRVRRGQDKQLRDEPILEAAVASVTAPARDSPEGEFFRRILPADVEAALSALPLVFREAVILVDLEGFSHKEAAQALECPVGTVMSRLWRSRRLLRRALQPAGAMELPEEAQL